MTIPKKCVAILIAILAPSAYATCSNGAKDWPKCTPTVTNPSTSTNTLSSLNTATSSSESHSESTSGAVLNGTLTASGGSSSLETFSRSNMYVLPAPVQAAPLPAGLCPQGDSMSIGILWNMFSYARSSTRTEMECLERVLAATRQAPQIHVIQAPQIPPTLSKRKPVKKSANKTLKAELCMTPEANACKVK